MNARAVRSLVERTESLMREAHAAGAPRMSHKLNKAARAGRAELYESSDGDPTADVVVSQIEEQS